MDRPVGNVSVRAPKLPVEEQWPGYRNPVWKKEDKDKVTILYNIVERRKSLFMRAYFERNGFRYIDLGDHVKEDVRWGKEYGNRMECNPMYFTSGSLIRALMHIQRETGLSKEEIVEKYLFLGGGGQCGPCRYGLYPTEYLKVVNEAGFKGFRVMIFSSDLAEAPPRECALQIDLSFRINLMVAIVLADLLHVAECALRPRTRDRDRLLSVMERAEQELLAAYSNPLWLLTVPLALRKVGRLFAKIPRGEEVLPLLFITGEFFANLAHNDGNYNLRRFIMDEGAEPIPGLFTQRILYDNWRRIQEGVRNTRFSTSAAERRHWRKFLRKQRNSTAAIRLFWRGYRAALNPAAFGGRAELLDLDEAAELGRPYYHPEIFGGEGNLEIGEAVHYADKVDGIISSKPFGCMPSSGVSDGVMARITSLYPQINFLSIETSGDNEVSILGRVSMLIFKAKQNLNKRLTACRD
jgi:predicted nucleotide-binding protein (sugar kinase/HSP70/actin superfamily)